MKAYIYSKHDNKKFTQIDDVIKAIQYKGYIALITADKQQHLFPIWKYTIRVF